MVHKSLALAMNYSFVRFSFFLSLLFRPLLRVSFFFSSRSKASQDWHRCMALSFVTAVRPSSLIDLVHAAWNSLIVCHSKPFFVDSKLSANVREKNNLLHAHDTRVKKVIGDELETLRYVSGTSCTPLKTEEDPSLSKASWEKKCEDDFLITFSL